MAATISGLQDLPPHLLHRILTKNGVAAGDLACFEASCYSFRAAHGLLPLRFKSVAEVAAFDLCNINLLYLALCQQFRSQLLQRCGGSWKLLLRFLQAVEKGDGCVATPKGNIQVVTGKYHTLLLHGDAELFLCGSGLIAKEAGGQFRNNFMPLEVPIGISVTHVAGSYQHVAFVTSGGELFTYGDNSSCCCGHGQIAQTIFKPTLVSTLKGIPCKQVATGFSYTVVLTWEGEVYTCGANAHGQLGHGDVINRPVPEKVERLNEVCPVAQVSAGTNHTLVATRDGAVYSCGYGANFCLGHGHFTSELEPRAIEKFQEENLFMLRVAAGDEHSVAVDSNGKVYTWGKGYCGALGQGDETDKAIPALVASLRDTRAVQVCAKRRKTFVLSDDGMVFAFGWMALGSLGLTNRGSSDKILFPTLVESLKSHHISQVSTGFYHTVVISNKGTVLGFGDNDRAQLGSYNSCTFLEPVEMSFEDNSTMPMCSTEAAVA